MISCFLLTRGSCHRLDRNCSHIHHLLLKEVILNKVHLKSNLTCIPKFFMCHQLKRKENWNMIMIYLLSTSNRWCQNAQNSHFVISQRVHWTLLPFTQTHKSYTEKKKDNCNSIINKLYLKKRRTLILSVLSHPY